MEILTGGVMQPLVVCIIITLLGHFLPKIILAIIATLSDVEKKKKAKQIAKEARQLLLMCFGIGFGIVAVIVVFAVLKG